jgi:O-antigen/teichoic acid export membrane protein
MRSQSKRLLSNFSRSLRLLRLTSFDVATENGRADERYRRAYLTVLASVLSKCLGMLVMVSSIALTVPYLGADRFGIWMTVASFAGLLTFLDLGIGNAITNHVAQAAATGNRDRLTRAVTGGLTSLTVVAAVAGLILFIAASNLPWGRIVKVPPIHLAELRLAAICFSSLYALTIVTSGIQRVFAGLQQAYESQLVSAAGSVAACLGIYLAASSQASIPMLLAIMLGSQSGSALALIPLLIRRGHLDLKLSIQSTVTEGPKLFRVGGLFLALQIGTLVGWGSDSLIISSTLGTASVAVYGVAQRLFQFISQPLGIINAPLWGAYADANARSDSAFMRTALRRSLLLTSWMGLSGVILLGTFSAPTINAWTSGRISVPAPIIIAFAAWAMCEMIGNALSMFMNGCGHVKPQVVAVIVITLIGLPLKILAVNYGGLAVMVASFAILYVMVLVIVYGKIYRTEIFGSLNTLKTQ